MAFLGHFKPKGCGSCVMCAKVIPVLVHSPRGGAEADPKTEEIIICVLKKLLAT